MNDYKKPNGLPLSWLKTAADKGTIDLYTTINTTETALIVDWLLTDITSAELAQFKNNVSDLAAHVTAATETQLLRAYPKAASEDGFLKSCESLFASGLPSVDWSLVEKTLYTSVKQFYCMDIALFGAETINTLKNDVYFVATVKNKETNSLLGFIMASVTPALAYGTIKLINLVIIPECHNQGLEEPLLNSMLKRIPEVTRIETVVRPTNEQLLTSYYKYGFTQNNNPAKDPNHKVSLDCFIALEYNVHTKNK